MSSDARARRVALAGLISATLGGVTAPALAQQAAEGRALLEEIVVTATKREELLQDVPQTITAFSEQGIKDIAAQDFSGLLNSMSGVELRNVQAGQGGVTIRGVAELNSGNLYGGTGSASGLYLDEIPMTAAGLFPDINAFDLARVEVLKGPQGTLFGEGSLAGTVRLVANEPVSTGWGAAADLTYSSTEHGDSNTIINGMVNMPLVEDKLALRVVGYSKDMGGYIDTRLISTGEITEDTNTDDSEGGRATLLYTPNDRLSLSAEAVFSNADRGSRNRAGDDYIGSLSVPESADDEIRAYNGTLRYQFEGAELLATISSIDRNLDSVIDQAGLVPGVNFVFGLFGLSPVTGVFIDQTVETDTLTGEVRLVSTNDGPLQWTVGAFYKDLDSNYGLFADGVPSIPPQVWEAISQAISGGALTISEGYFTTGDSSNRQIAGFGEVSWDFNDSWQLIAGGRLFNEKRESTTAYGGLFPVLQGGPLPGSSQSEGDTTLFNPRVTLTYALRDDAMTYGTISRGFRSGGQNDLWTLVPGGNQDYDPEELTNYEIGFKSAWNDGRLLFNASAYYLDWTDLQAVTAEGTGGIGETIGNIGSAHSLGLDLELKAMPIDGLELSLAATLLEAETDEDVLVPDPAGGPAQTVPSGTRIPRTAEQTFSLGGTYRFGITDNLGGFLRANYTYVGDSISSITRPDDVVPSRSVVDLRAGIEGKNWQLYVFADNVTDEEIYLFQENFPDPVTGADQFYYGRPRTIGVNLRVNY